MIVLSDALMKLEVEPFLRDALREDIGRGGDITSDLLISDKQISGAYIRSRVPGVVAGMEVAKRTFHMIDNSIDIDIKVSDGEQVRAGDDLMYVHGNTKVILAAERVSLNVLGYMSGIATATYDMMSLIRHTAAKVSCTRKIFPMGRLLAKYAVRVGGGGNHRFGLDNMILIKDNHLEAVGGVLQAFEKLENLRGHVFKVAMEVNSLEQVSELVRHAKGRCHHIMLDNMSVYDMREAVKKVCECSIVTEATGGIHKDSIVEVAETGVDYISIGKLTHSAPVMDVGLDFCVN